jgi:hypothetical protein
VLRKIEQPNEARHAAIAARARWLSEMDGYEIQPSIDGQDAFHIDVLRKIQ